MIPVTQLMDNINNSLNALLPGGMAFSIIPDGGDYVPPVRENNSVTVLIEGIAQIAESAIVPINNLSVATQTLSIVVAVPIDPDKPTQDSLSPVREAISAFTSKPFVTLMTDGDKTKYSVSVYGSQPQAGELTQRPSIDFGESITYQFNVFYSFVESGINSLDYQVTFDGEVVSFTEMSLICTPVTDGGAFSDSDGAVKNYSTGYALELQISVPALENNLLTLEFAKFLIQKDKSVHKVTLSYAGISGEFNMIFATSNITARGVENIGHSISLIEALEIDNGGL